MQPAVNIVITADEESIRLVCATIGFIAMCWVACKALVVISKAEKPTEEPS
jgi:hypothetical protein